MEQDRERRRTGVARAIRFGAASGRWHGRCTHVHAVVADEGGCA